jgi:hypothetical protein
MVEKCGLLFTSLLSRVWQRIALLSRAGLSLNQDSPSYLTAEFSLDLPTGRSRGRDEQLR